MRLSRRFVAAEIKATVKFVELISQFTRLRRAGKQYVGLCPFHSECRPSFYIHVQKKVFYCFGCGAGGDVFEFVMRMNGCNFRRASEIVSQFAPGGARESEPRSGERFRAGRGLPPPTAKRPGRNSQSVEGARAEVLAKLAKTCRRLTAIEARNRAASQALATACEPDRSAPFTCQKPDNSHG
jgi:CHC2-type zinc finger protein